MAEKFDEKKINEALELLNELAKEKKADLLAMVSQKYSHLKSAIDGAAGKMQDQARETFAQAEDQAKEFVSTINGNIHRNPWPYLGGTALGFLILGFFLGRPKK